jgi:hypothetical protein
MGGRGPGGRAAVGRASPGAAAGSDDPLETEPVTGAAGPLPLRRAFSFARPARRAGFPLPAPGRDVPSLPSVSGFPDFPPFPAVRLYRPWGFSLHQQSCRSGFTGFPLSDLSAFLALQIPPYIVIMSSCFFVSVFSGYSAFLLLRTESFLAVQYSSA